MKVQIECTICYLAEIDCTEEQFIAATIDGSLEYMEFEPDGDMQWETERIVSAALVDDDDTATEIIQYNKPVITRAHPLGGTEERVAIADLFEVSAEQGRTFVRHIPPSIFRDNPSSLLPLGYALVDNVWVKPNAITVPLIDIDARRTNKAVYEAEEAGERLKVEMMLINHFKNVTQ